MGKGSSVCSNSKVNRESFSAQRVPISSWNYCLYHYYFYRVKTKNKFNVTLLHRYTNYIHYTYAGCEQIVEKVCWLSMPKLNEKVDHGRLIDFQIILLNYNCSHN